MKRNLLEAKLDKFIKARYYRDGYVRVETLTYCAPDGFESDNEPDEIIIKGRYGKSQETTDGRFSFHCYSWTSYAMVKGMLMLQIEADGN